MKHFFWGIVGIILSYVIIRYRSHIVDWTGKFAWAEKYLGSGGTYNAMVLLALLIFIFSILYMTGSVDFFIEGMVKFFGGGESA